METKAATVPPRPIQAQWQISGDDPGQGPYTRLEMALLQAKKRLTPDTLVSREGVQDWVKAGADPALALIFQRPAAARAPASSPTPQGGHFGIFMRGVQWVRARLSR